MRRREMGLFRRLVPAVLVVALVAAACGNGDDGDAGADDGEPDVEETEEGGGSAATVDADSLEIVTAPTGSIFFPLGSAIAQQLEAGLDIPVTAAPSAGSGENVVLLSGGDAEIGIIASNALVPAYEGMTPYDEPYEELRPLAHLFPNALVVFALESSGFETIADLEGARVGVGLEARTWDHFIGPLFASQGMVYGENITPVYAGFEDMANQVRDGQLDAAIGTGGSDSPSPAITALASEVGVTYLEWDQDGVQSVADEIGFVNVFADYPGDVLEGYGGDTYFTADIGGPYLAATTAMSDDTAYEVTRIFHEQLETMANDVAVVRWILDAGLENLVQPLGDLPFHPGAVRYWQEVGAMD
ncbi:MAG: TAXI family TRAP transporter solute-binding subunit [Nitriliruptoraceae bacterium]|nr:TAXI family TRAP transporter solute-binding subunit [Nitriliruptoraceae bacterium]